MIKSIGNHLLLVFLLTIVANADQNGKPNEKESLASMPKSFSPISNQDSKINLKNNDEQIMGKNGLNLKRSIPLLNIEPRQPNDELSELEKAKLFCQQLAFANQLNIDYDRNSEFEHSIGPKRDSTLIFPGEEDEMKMEEHEDRDTSLSTKNVNQCIRKYISDAQTSSNLHQSRTEQTRKDGIKRSFYDYTEDSSDEDNGYSYGSDSFSKKLDFLFGHEGIRFKRANSRPNMNENKLNKNKNSIFLQLFVPVSTAKPEFIRQLARRTVSLGPVLRSANASTLTIAPTSTINHSSEINSSTMPTSMSTFKPINIIRRLLMFNSSPNLYEPKQQPKSETKPLLVYTIPRSQYLLDDNPSKSKPIRFVKKNPFDKEGIRFRRSTRNAVTIQSFHRPIASNPFPFDNEGIRFKKSPFEAEGIRFKKTPFEAEGIRYRKSSPFNDEGIRFKKSPFDEEGIRYKKSLPFNDEGIRFKKSPFEAEGIRYKKSPFDEEGIRYKKSPFDEEGIRY